MEKQTSGLFEKPIQGAKLTSEILHRDYDGTVFNGLNAVRVALDEQGEVVRVDSFFTSSGEPSAPFVRGKTGGWQGEGGFYGDPTDMGKKLASVVTSVKEDWKLWKKTEAQHQGVDFRTWKAQHVDAMAEEYKHLTNEPEQ